MSADNTLVILQNKKKIYVYDVNFSDISSYDEWDFPMTLENSKFLTNKIINSRYWLLHECDTVDQAEGFCKRFMRSNVVEYGPTSIVVHY